MLLTRCLVVRSGVTGNVAHTNAPSSMSTAVAAQFPAETRPGHFGHVEHEPFRYCRICNAQFEDYDERYGRVVQFCCFCGDRLVRAVPQDINNHSQPANVTSVRSGHTPNWPSISPRSRSPTRCGGSLGRRSRSPETRIRGSGVEHSRSPLSRSRGEKNQVLPTPDETPNSQRDRLRNLKHGRAPSTPHQKNATYATRVVKKKKNVIRETIEIEGKQEKEGSNVKIVKGVARDNPSNLAGSDVRSSRLPPLKDVRVARAVSPTDAKADTRGDAYKPAGEISHSQKEFHTTVANLRQELSPVPNERTPQEQRQIDYERMDRRWREEELAKKAANPQVKVTEKQAKKKQVMIDLTIEDE